MSARLMFSFAVVCAIFAVPVLAQTNPPAAAPPKSAFPLADFLGFAQGLQIDPKIITATDGDGTTIGLEYQYDREIKRAVLSGRTDIGFSLRSSGLVVADHEKVPNDVFSHGLRLSIIDIFPAMPAQNSAAWKHNAELKERISSRYFIPWRKQAESDSPDHAVMANLLDDAARELKDYGQLEAETTPAQWYLRDSSGERTPFRQALTEIKERQLFLAFDLDADLEHDQPLTNLQFVGSAQLRGKLFFPFLDFPFELLRGGGPPKNWLNRAGGPHFWLGAAVVEASDNEARTSLTTEHKVFPRFHAGIFYRTEIFSVSETHAVGLELLWRYYHEFDAPEAIRDAKLHRTSYFKATLLFPGNLFLQYTDGKLPVEVEGGSTVSAGWRYNF